MFVRSAPRLTCFRLACCLLVVAVVSLAASLGQAASVEELQAALSAALPAKLADFTTDRASQIARLASEIEVAFAYHGSFVGLEQPQAFVERVDSLHAQHAATDALLQQMLAQRTLFAAHQDGVVLRQQMRAYLRITAVLIDLSARQRYTLMDATRDAAYELEPQSAEMLNLISVLTKHRSSIGAAAVMDELTIPPASRLPRAVAAATETKTRVLSLIAATRHADLVAPVARFVKDPASPPELVVAGAATIYALGLPQSARPNTEPGLPVPPITPAELAQRLSALPERALSTQVRSERDRWVTYFQYRAKQGLAEEKYRLGNCEVLPGDWLLMRNPSPYNRFTDLSPGLFTHVGIITSETGSDGIRRMVLVDLPERGKVIQPVCLETYVQRTLHYVVLRHPDRQVAATMAEAARQLIGNPAQFDLNFRTDRIASLRGESLAGKNIHTYCAGLLLVCAQQSTAAQRDFFPFVDYAAGGNTADNLAKLGLTFGENFVSPTGAIFSDKLELVGQRPAMYSPRRDVIDQVYDHFAAQLALSDLNPSPDLYQSLRLKLAEAGKANPLLGKALSEALNVNENLDLVSAAKFAGVIETLDEVAESAAKQFDRATDALRAGTDEELAAEQLTPAERKEIADLRARHAELYALWAGEKLSPRGLRISLVNYYTRWGQGEIDRRFFKAP